MNRILGIFISLSLAGCATSQPHTDFYSDAALKSEADYCASAARAYLD